MKYAELQTAAQKAAREAAMDHWKFSGLLACQNMNLTPEQTEKIKEGLLFYAETGAHEAIQYARNHALLKD